MIKVDNEITIQEINFDKECTIELYGEISIAINGIASKLITKTIVGEGVRAMFFGSFIIPQKYIDLINCGKNTIKDLIDGGMIYPRTLNNYKLEVVKFSCTIPFYAATFLIFTLLQEFPVLEELFPIFYPHMWLSSFTGEYVFSPMIALAINCLISILIYVIIRKKSEY